LATKGLAGGVLDGDQDHLGATVLAMELAGVQAEVTGADHREDRFELKIVEGDVAREDVAEMRFELGVGPLAIGYFDK
jgi:hypothetical protein